MSCHNDLPHQTCMSTGRIQFLSRLRSLRVTVGAPAPQRSYLWSSVLWKMMPWSSLNRSASTSMTPACTIS